MYERRRNGDGLILGPRTERRGYDELQMQMAPPERAAEAPISLNASQFASAKEWAADDRLWTTQETVEINLQAFARVILRAAREEPPR